MKTLLCLALVSLALACSSEVETADSAAPTGRSVAAGSYSVTCGCKLESVGHCGNYIAIDGQWLAIANSAALGLGKMEWCREPDPVPAEAAGSVADGQFLGTALTTH